jgi:MoaA/NifB/PqqE/SkfB family radical SAM enzyme
VRAAGLRQLARVALDPDGAVLQVENTNYCNFRCRYCATHSHDSNVTVARGHMSAADFAGLVARHPRALLVIIQGDGEPLMDPTLFDKIAAARAAGRVTQVISNGSLLTPAMIDRLAAEGPDLMLFSVDAAAPETVMRERRGMRYHDVRAAIRTLARARKRPMVLGLLSVVYGPFDADVERALLSFNDLGIDVLFYKQLNGAYAGRIRGYQAPRIDPIPRRTLRALNYVVSHQRIAAAPPCPALRWGFPYFLWDGTETACCVLNHPQYATAEFSRQRLLARWRARDLPIECHDCSFFAGYS